jgi:hypothetical protein
LIVVPRERKLHGYHVSSAPVAQEGDLMLTPEKLDARRVRLFPSHNIKSDKEAELKAASTLLAVASGVSEFGRRVVSMAGGPAGRLECYTEVPFPEVPGGRKEVRPDGLLWVRRGAREWKALVEIKVGSAPLDQPQTDLYHSLACDESLDALITISNEAALPDGSPPHIAIDGRRARKVPVTHFSWDRLLSEAQMLCGQEAVADDDQQWILNEWVRYVTDDCSRIIDPPQLGPYWTDLVRAAQAGDLRSASMQADDVARYWDAYLRKLGFRLRAQLGVNVEQKLSREEKADSASRLKRLCVAAIEQGVLGGVLQIPGAVGDVSADVIVAAQSVRYSVEIDAPNDGKPKTRINWLLRQLERDGANADIVVKVNWQYKKFRTQATLAEALADPSKLLVDTTGMPVPGDALPRSFTLERTMRLSKAKTRSSAPILEGISTGFEDFYGNVVAKVKRWVAPAPQMPDEALKPGAALVAAQVPGLPISIDQPAVPSEAAVVAQEPPTLPDTELPK